MAPRLHELADKMCSAWVAFARTGKPNHPGLPDWKPYDVKYRATMVFDFSTELVKDPLRKDRLAMAPFALSI